MDLADHLDLMFGVGRRRMMTGDHVEVWREAPAEKDRQPYFSKRFIAQRSPGAIDWNLREALLILTMDELGSAHLQQFDSTSHTQDRTQRDLRTRHAGPSLQNWLDLPVARADRRLAHAFHDCAHWFALARYGLAALRDINGAGVLHLDLKPDNICIPTDPAIFDPESGGGFHLAVSGLRLIDFAFQPQGGRTSSRSAGRSAWASTRQPEYQRRGSCAMRSSRASATTWTRSTIWTGAPTCTGWAGPWASSSATCRRWAARARRDGMRRAWNRPSS